METKGSICMNEKDFACLVIVKEISTHVIVSQEL